MKVTVWELKLRWFQVKSLCFSYSVRLLPGPGDLQIPPSQRKSGHQWRQHSGVEVKWALPPTCCVILDQSLDLALLCLVLSGGTQCSAWCLGCDQHVVENHWMREALFSWDCAATSFTSCFPSTGNLTAESNMGLEACVSPFGWDVSSGQTWDCLCFRSSGRDHWRPRVWMHCLCSFSSVCHWRSPLVLRDVIKQPEKEHRCVNNSGKYHLLLSPLRLSERWHQSWSGTVLLSAPWLSATRRDRFGEGGVWKGLVSKKKERYGKETEAVKDTHAHTHRTKRRRDVRELRINGTSYQIPSSLMLLPQQC